jgi:hypothetical protein
LHAPQIDRSRFYRAKNYGLNDEADEDDGEKSRENRCGVEIVAGFEDVPTDAP